MELVLLPCVTEEQCYSLTDILQDFWSYLLLDYILSNLRAVIFIVNISFILACSLEVFLSLWNDAFLDINFFVILHIRSSLSNILPRVKAFQVPSCHMWCLVSKICIWILSLLNFDFIVLIQRVFLPFHSCVPKTLVPWFN